MHDFTFLRLESQIINLWIQKLNICLLEFQIRRTCLLNYVFKALWNCFFANSIIIPTMSWNKCVHKCMLNSISFARFPSFIILSKIHLCSECFKGILCHSDTLRISVALACVMHNTKRPAVGCMSHHNIWAWDFSSVLTEFPYKVTITCAIFNC